MSQELDTPYIPFIGLDLEFETAKRNVNYFTGHVVFFMFNVINVVWILAFEGYVFGNLAKNFLLKLILCGCFIQALSCMTSLIRYNINEEFGDWAIAGVWTGNLAFAFMNTAMSEVFFVGSRKRVFWWHLVGGFWFLITTASSIYTHVKWDEIQFNVFRITVPISVIYQTIVMSYCLVVIKKGKLTISLGNETMERLLMVLIGINGLAFLLMLSSSAIAGDVIPMLTYPKTGWYFTTCMIFIKYVGAGQLKSTAGEAAGTPGEETALV